LPDTKRDEESIKQETVATLYLFNVVMNTSGNSISCEKANLVRIRDSMEYGLELN